MADIIVDVSLPSPITTNVTSPTQALGSNVYIPGPQGPAGPRGAGSNINGLSPDLLYLTGRDGIEISSNGVDIIYISGNSGYFQSAVNSLTTNLQSTGSNLYTLLTNFSGNLDATYASDLQLYNTGSTLDNKINSLSGYSASDVNLASTGSTLDIKINNLSGNLTSNYATITNLASTGSALDSKINSLSGSSASTINLANTGSSLDNKINSLSGNLTSTYSTILNLATTGSTLDSKINSLSGYSASIVNLQSTGSNLYSMLTGFSGNLDATYATDFQLATTGSTLNTRINNLSGYINSSSSNILFTTGNQIKSGRLIIGDEIVDPNSPYTLSVQSNSLQTWLEILNHSGANQGAFLGLVNNNFEQWNSQAGDILFVTSENPSDGTERLRIKNNGKIGIGTNSPSEKLEVVGNIIANNLVYNTGNQNISGTKTFDLAPIISGNPFITGNLSLYATTINLGTTGSTLDTKINNLSGYVNSQDVSISNNLISTGFTLDNKINSLSGWSASAVNLTSTGATLINNLFNTGSNLNTKIDNLSGYVNSQDNSISTNLYNTGNTLNNKINSLSGYTDSQDTTISNNLRTTGSTLDTKINNLSGYVNIQDTTISNNLTTTGITLNNKINSLSGVSVLTYGDQIVVGTKYFNEDVYIHNLYVTGDEFIANVTNNFVESPYLLLNITGGAIDGGIFFVTGSGLTGINDYGPIIGFDHSNKFKIGVARRSDDLSFLPDIASVQQIEAYSGVANNTFSTITNLYNTGNNLNNRINSLSGWSASALNLASTGSTLDSKINSLSGWSASAVNLFNTGSILDSKINSLSGNLTSNYATISNLALTGSTLDSKINSLSGWSASSVNLATTGSTLNSKINSLSGWSASAINLASTGSTLDSKINSLSGWSASAANLATTGSTLNTRINNLSGYINSSSSNIVFTTGNQTISGTKTFIQDTVFGDSSQGDFLVISGNNFTVYGSGNFTSGLFVNGNPVLTGSSTLYATTVNLASTGSTLDNKINNLSGVSVLTFGNQTINGLKTFTSGIDIYSGTSPQILRIFNSTGTNSGEFAVIDWEPNLGIVLTGTNAVIIGTQASNSGILRDVIITGENIALSPRSGRLYINGTSSLNDHLLQTSPCSGNITGYITGLGFTGNYTGNYEGGYFLGRTKITQNTVQLVDSSFGSNYITKNTTAPSQIFRSVAVSSDGRYQITAVGDYGAANGYVYVSNDYGNTWTPRITDTIRSWRGVAISADGKYQTACHNNGFIYVSNDYGNTWTAKSSSLYWQTIAMSSDGKYQTATGGASGTQNIQIYISSDYGNTWIAKGNSTVYISVTMSSDGKYQYAVENASSSGSIYRSFDYGNTWTGSLSGSSYTSIATSADGRFIIIGRTSNTLLISNNYGASFVTKSISANYFSVAISDNGKYMVAGLGAYFVSTGGIYFSSDYGNTWKLITPSTRVWMVAISSNAKYVIGAASGSSTPIHIFKTDELIDGNITINNNLTLPSGDFYSYNATGVNSGEFGLIGWRNNQFVIGSQSATSGILRDVVITGNNININGSGAFNIFDNTNIVGNLTVSGNTTITGHLSAASKSFLINHPTQVGKKLQYGSLESPYHGIRLTDKNKISADIIKVYLPDYISSLVNDEKVNVQLTNINHDKVLFVKEINVNENNFTVGMNRGWFDKNEYEFYWSFTAERKDIPKLTVEF